MKRIIALFLIISTLAVIILSMASCGGGGGLSGTYTNNDYGGEISFKFSGNKVTMSSFGMTIEGTYKINGDKIEMTIMGETETSSFEKVSNKVIKIDGDEFIKK